VLLPPSSHGWKDRGDDAHKPPVLTHAILDPYVALPRCTLAFSSSLPPLASLPLCFSLLQVFALVLGASFPLLYCSLTFACFATHTKSSCLYLLGPYHRPSVGFGGSCAACLPRFFAQLGPQLARARHLGWYSGPTAGIALVPWRLRTLAADLRAITAGHRLAGDELRASRPDAAGNGAVAFP
jgi:hypothetical protein